MAILLGFRYRLCVALFFALFTYVELIDQAACLNHYCFISLVSFLLIFLPAQGSLSIDAWRKPQLRQHLTEQQARHMAYQPDMIWQFAQYLGRNNPFDPRHEIAVYAEALVARNGRPAKPLIDPNANLLALPRDLFPADWFRRDQPKPASAQS